jgi:hypothetical protein
MIQLHMLVCENSFITAVRTYLGLLGLFISQKHQHRFEGTVRKVKTLQWRELIFTF